MSVRPLVPCLVAGLLVAASCLPGVAWAGDEAVADALFREGKELATAGRYTQACPKFEASYDAAKALGTLLNLADCWERDNKLARAERRFSEAVALADTLKDERTSFASERLAALAPRVPRLTLNVKSGSETLLVEVAGGVLDEARFGLPVGVDPGPVVIRVLRPTAAGGKPDALETTSVSLSEGEQKTIALDLVETARKHPVAVATEPEPDRPEQRVAGIVILSTGLTAVGAFAVLEAIAISQTASATSVGNCRENGDQPRVCSPKGAELIAEARTLAEVGQWLGVGGAAAAGVGLTLLLTLPSQDEPAQEARSILLPMVSAQGGGLQWIGVF